LTCKETIRHLSDYLDGELDPSLIAGLERHLEHCDDCRLVVDTTRKTIEISCNSEPAPLPSDVQQRLLRSVGAKLGWKP
jgi:anti-sigma factor (TIGR02949 family)